MNTIDNPVYTQAIAYLRNHILNGAWKKGDKLPNYRTLAQQVGVGHSAMSRALSLLKSEKLLCCKNGVGIFVGQEIPTTQLPVKAQKTERWEQVKHLLAKELLEGSYQNSEFLPSSKELVNRYGINMRTLLKALTALCTEKLLEPYKRRYRICQSTPAPSSNTIVFIMSGSFFNYELWNIQKVFFDEFVTGIEKECTIRNIHLKKIAYSKEQLEACTGPNILGYIVWHSFELHEKTFELTTILRRVKRPVAVCHYMDSALWIHKQNIDIYNRCPGLFNSSPDMFRQSGRTMGHFLIRKGHKAICCLSTEYENSMPNGIYEGLHDAYASVNRENAVYQICEPAKPPELYDEKDRIVEQNLRGELDTLDKMVQSVRDQIALPFSEKLYREVMETRFARHARLFWAPAFRKAQSIANASAWICVRDDTAIYGALEYLKAKGLKVPAQISVAGFCDLPESKTYNLTTCHFDYFAAARKMVAMVLYPEYAKKTLCIKGTNVFEIEGMVIDRGSV